MCFLYIINLLLNASARQTAPIGSQRFGTGDSRAESFPLTRFSNRS
jgi:hypothetical protein